MISRRNAIWKLGLTGTVVVSTAKSLNLHAQAPPSAPALAPAGPHKLPPLPYAFDALEPLIDAKTMEIHHDRHHAAYVNNLNKALADFPDWSQKPADELVRQLGAVPEKIRAAVRNNGGGHVNHAFFWRLLRKNNGAGPTGELAAAIDKKFGSYAAFREEFTKAATGVFGSGWAWLTADSARDLRIESTANQDSPLTAGRTPILGLDVWEHAYYLKYQNRRPEYVAAFFQAIHWDFVAEEYRKAAG